VLEVSALVVAVVWQSASTLLGGQVQLVAEQNSPTAIEV